MMFSVSRMLPFWNAARTSKAGQQERPSTGRRPRPAPDLRPDHLEDRRVPSGYTLVNLGSLGGTYGYVGGINSSGEVIGGSNLANNTAEHAFLFSHGKMTDLGILGGSISQAYGINDKGEVVGLSSTTAASSSQSYSLFVDQHGHMKVVGSVASSSPFGGAQVNNHGDIVGLPLADGDASLIRHGKTIDLGSLGGLGSAAWGLNNQDEVVGYSAVSQSSSSQVDHAFLYEHGKMMDLGTLGGTESEGIAINNHGEIIGDSNTSSGAVDGFIYDHGHMTDLGTLGGPTTEAFAINDHGDVVGFSDLSASSAHGFLYENGKMIDLNSLLPAGSQFTITDAEAINNRGQIAATAISTNTSDQTVYVVLLNPAGGHRR